MGRAGKPETGKLELKKNLVFRHLRGQTEEIYFARNGWECDFAVLQPGRLPQLIQVTWRLDSTNIARELKGLIAGRKFIGDADCLMLIESSEPGLPIPGWIRMMPVQEWLLE